MTNKTPEYIDFIIIHSELVKLQTEHTKLRTRLDALTDSVLSMSRAEEPER